MQSGSPATCSQAKAEKEFQGGGDAEQPVDAEEAERASKEADSRSVYVGQVDYDCTPEELQRHFQVNIATSTEFVLVFINTSSSLR